MARASMAALIARTRILINDTGGSPTFTDDDIQAVMDGRPRTEARYLQLTPSPTYVSGQLVYLDYYSSLTDWEDDATFWQSLSTQVAPSTSEPIAGHWKFTASTSPGVYIIGKTYDVYRAAADLLERRAAKVALDYDVIVGGQTFRRGQAATALRDLAKTYRMQQRPGAITMNRSDLANGEEELSLAPRAIDYGKF